MQRRGFIATVGTAVTVGAAGCSSDDGGTDNGEETANGNETDDGGTANGNETADGESNGEEMTDSDGTDGNDGTDDDGGLEETGDGEDGRESIDTPTAAVEAYYRALNAGDTEMMRNILHPASPLDAAEETESGESDVKIQLEGVETLAAEIDSSYFANRDGQEPDGLSGDEIDSVASSGQITVLEITSVLTYEVDGEEREETETGINMVATQDGEWRYLGVVSQTNR